MSDNRIERIRALAHQLWEQDGRPEGRAGEHWSRATEEIEAQEATEANAALGETSAGSGAPETAGNLGLSAGVQTGGMGSIGAALAGALGSTGGEPDRHERAEEEETTPRLPLGASIDGR